MQAEFRRRMRHESWSKKTTGSKSRNRRGTYELHIPKGVGKPDPWIRRNSLTSTNCAGTRLTRRSKLRTHRLLCGDTRFRRGRQCARVVPEVKWGDLVSTEEQAHGYEFRVYSAVGLEEVTGSRRQRWLSKLLPRHHALDQRGPLLALASRSDPLTPASTSSFRPNSQRRSERRLI